MSSYNEKFEEKMKKIQIIVDSLLGTIPSNGTINGNTISFSFGGTKKEIKVRGEIDPNIELVKVIPDIYGGGEIMVGSKTYQLNENGNQVVAVEV